MKSSLVSIIIPVYNVESWLERCLRSVVCQTYSNIEIILIDDGSTDKSGVLCDNWKCKDQRIIVIHQENSGPGGARNAGLDACTGEYVLFVDSDDFIEPTLVEECIRSASENNAEIVLFNFSRDRNGVAKENGLKKSCYLNSKTIYDGILWDYVPSCPIKFYSRSIWESIRFPNEMVWEDFYIMPQVFEHSQKSVLLDKVLYHYEKGNPNSITRQTKSFYKYCWFLGWKLRKEISEELHDEALLQYVLARSLRLAVTALGLNTYDRLLSDTKVGELREYIHKHSTMIVSPLGYKYQFLLWAEQHWPCALCIYGRIAYICASLKRLHFLDTVELPRAYARGFAESRSRF